MNLDPEQVTVLHLHVVAPGTATALERREEPWGSVIRIPIPLEPNAPRIDVARAQAEALRSRAPQEYWEADVVHAHVGLPTAWAVTQVPPPKARVVTVEHASYLSTLLKRDDTRQAYGEMLEETSMHLMSGEREARMVRGAFPALREKVVAVGNPVNEAVFRARAEAPTHLDHWLYAGNITEAKGVARAVELYLAWRSRSPEREGSFTIVGQGPAARDIRAIADASQWGHEVRLVGPRAASELGELMRHSDVLVHLSHKETFGLTVVEAAMCGMAVITTRCGGPQDTLAEAFDRGQALLLHVEPRPEDMDLVQRFAEQLPGATFSAAQHLQRRYGSQAFGAQLRAVSDGLNPFTTSGDAAVVGLLATTRQGVRLAQHLASIVVGAGAAPVVCLAPKEELGVLDSRARGVDLSGVGTAPGAALYLRVLYIWPLLLLALPARWFVAKIARFDGRGGRYARKVRRALSRRIDAARQRKQALRTDPPGVSGPFWRVAPSVGGEICRVEPTLLKVGSSWIICDGQSRALLKALEKEFGFRARRVDASAADVAELVADHLARST